MRLALNGQGHYTDFSGGYDLYVKRSRKGRCVDFAMYRRIVRAYCRLLAERLAADGLADLPCGLGSVSAAVITRKPQYRGKAFVGYGAMDWNTGKYDGKLKAFGMVYLPRRDRNRNLRCLGFVANRRLFRRMKDIYSGGRRPWTPVEFNDDMI